MSNEEILSEIGKAMSMMADTKSIVNEALCHAQNIVKKYDEPTISEDTLEMERIKALNDGRNEVWEFVRKTNTSVHPQKAVELLDFFGVNNYRDIYAEYTPQEALAKLEAYEKEQAAFKRGNIVEFVDTDELAIYIGQYADGMHAVVFDECNVPQKVSTDEIRKTDKHIDIQGVLRQIGGGVNGNS